MSIFDWFKRKPKEPTFHEFEIKRLREQVELDEVLGDENQRRHRIATIICKRTWNDYYKKLREKFPDKLILTFRPAHAHLIRLGGPLQTWKFTMPPDDVPDEPYGERQYKTVQLP